MGRVSWYDLKIKYLKGDFLKSPTWEVFFKRILALMHEPVESRELVDAKGDFYSNFRFVEGDQDQLDVLSHRDIYRHLNSEGLKLGEVKSPTFFRKPSATSAKDLKRILLTNGIEGEIKYEFLDGAFPVSGKRDYTIRNAIEIVDQVEEGLYLIKSNLSFLVPGTDFIDGSPILGVNLNFIRVDLDLSPGLYDVRRTDSIIPISELALKSVIAVELVSDTNTKVTDTILSRVSPARCEAKARFINIKESDLLLVNDSGINLDYEPFIQFVDSDGEDVPFLRVPWFMDKSDFGFRQMRNLTNSVAVLDDAVFIPFIPLSDYSDLQALSGSVVGCYYRVTGTIAQGDFVYPVFTVVTISEVYELSLQFSTELGLFKVKSGDNPYVDIPAFFYDEDEGPYFVLEIMDGYFIINDVILENTPEDIIWESSYISNMLVNSTVVFNDDPKELVYIPLPEGVFALDFNSGERKSLSVLGYSIKHTEVSDITYPEITSTDSCRVTMLSVGSLIDVGSFEGSSYKISNIQLGKGGSIEVSTGSVFRISEQNIEDDNEKVSISALRNNTTFLFYYSGVEVSSTETEKRVRVPVLWEYFNPDVVGIDVDEQLLTPKEFAITKDSIAVDVDVISVLSEEVSVEDENISTIINVSDELDSIHENSSTVRPDE